MMKHALKLLAALWLEPLAALHAAAIAPLATGRVPFPNALDAAAVVQDRLDDINGRALVLGNGDLSGWLWERTGVLCLRVTKSDVRDARVDTSQDPPMLQVDIQNQKWKGGGRPIWASWSCKAPARYPPATGLTFLLRSRRR
jgi:hypothetical protein